MQYVFIQDTSDSFNDSEICFAFSCIISKVASALPGKKKTTLQFNVSLCTEEMAVFKIAALQKVVDNSVSLSELELANRQYNELTAKYRDILQKDNMLVQRTNNLEHLEVS